MKLQYFYESFRFQQKKNRISLSFKKKEKEFSKFLILDIYYFVIPTKAGIQFIKLERIMRLPHIFFTKNVRNDETFKNTDQKLCVSFYLNVKLKNTPRVFIEFILPVQGLLGSRSLTNSSFKAKTPRIEGVNLNQYK